METVLRIKPDGTIQCVYTDRFPLRRLGVLSMRRVTKVEFDPESQEWVARFVKTGEGLARGPSRQGVVDIEVFVLQEMLKEGVSIE